MPPPKQAGETDKKVSPAFLNLTVGLSMMCYKNQKTSPKDKKEYK